MCSVRACVCVRAFVCARARVCVSIFAPNALRFHVLKEIRHSLLCGSGSSSRSSKKQIATKTDQRGRMSWFLFSSFRT